MFCACFFDRYKLSVQKEKVVRKQNVNKGLKKGVKPDKVEDEQYSAVSDWRVVIGGEGTMFQLKMKDRTKAAETAVYYVEDKRDILGIWGWNMVMEPSAEFLDVELKVGAKQDFTMEKCRLVIHNTKGQECRYYIDNLLLKVRWAKLGEEYRKLACFVATGIAKENEYDEGGYERVECYGNPVLKHQSSESTPLVSDFEEDFKREKITMACYKEIGRFLALSEVNEDIARKDLSGEELELLFRDIPGELG